MTVCQSQNSNHKQFFYKAEQHNEAVFLQKRRLCQKKKKNKNLNRFVVNSMAGLAFFFFKVVI